ncbi:hypothetical protein [Pelomonas cellulosilytica]|nr:hypothetical protein [Pelomonas sp. P8]
MKKGFKQFMGVEHGGRSFMSRTVDDANDRLVAGEFPLSNS